MPLFKGQGCKSTPGKAIRYVTDEKKAEIVSSQNLDDSRSYAEQFRETARIYGKGEKFAERKYYHFKLSCDRADRVSAADHHEYAEALAKKLFPEYECVIATHTDTDTVHSHIIVNAVNFETGQKLHCNNRLYGRWKDAANDLGAERGYATLDFRKPARERIATQERLVELKGGTSWKEELREVIGLAKQDAKTMSEFEKYLQQYGVELTRNTEKTIAYKHPKKTKAIRGEKLGADYTRGAVADLLEQNRRKHELPEKCYIWDAARCMIGIAERGARGYRPDVDSFLNARKPSESGWDTVDRLNGDLGVTPAQASAMAAGCTDGWESAAADPANYDECGRWIGRSPDRQALIESGPRR